MQTELRLVRYATDEYNPNQANYGIHTVFLDDTGKVIGRSPGDPAIIGDSADAILSTLRTLLEALGRPVVDDSQRTEGLAILYDVPAEQAVSPADTLSNQEYV